MSQDYNQTGLFSFSNDFEAEQRHDVAQHIRRDKLRVQVQQALGPAPPLVAMEEDSIPASYEQTGMLSEMFSFHNPPQQQRSAAAATAAGEWYGNMLPEDGDQSAAAAMQLFMTNPQPQQPRSPNSPNTPPPRVSATSTLQPFQQIANATPQFTWAPDVSNPSHQGLSLSLSSSLQHLEVAKTEEFGIGNSEIPFSHPAQGYHGNYWSFPGAIPGNHIGFGPSSSPPPPSTGVANVLRNSKYVKAARELLEELCSAGRAHLKRNKSDRVNSRASEGATSATPSPPLSTADKIEHQRRKVKLLSMLDEVDRRYNHYCEQMQMVVNSFDLVMGCGSAIPYTALALKAMSRHFRCLKDAIRVQLRNSCELLGEKDAGTSWVSKGETPRLKILDQSFRQQRAFHQMGMMEQEAWRPQRGLPDRSVDILRAWLFEHFLHPYPNDPDKHFLSRQTGLSRSQVSNWFINARVRLWKPMVEEMYQQESKEEEQEQDNNVPTQQNSLDNTTQTLQNQNQNIGHGGLTTSATQNPTPSSAAALNTTGQRYESDPSSYLSVHDPDACQDYAPSELIRFGSAGGDVSLTLGLRHAGRDFGTC